VHTNNRASQSTEKREQKLQISCHQWFQPPFNLLPILSQLSRSPDNNQIHDWAAHKKLSITESERFSFIRERFGKLIAFSLSFFSPLFQIVMLAFFFCAVLFKPIPVSQLNGVLPQHSRFFSALINTRAFLRVFTKQDDWKIGSCSGWWWKEFLFRCQLISLVSRVKPETSPNILCLLIEFSLSHSTPLSCAPLFSWLFTWWHHSRRVIRTRMITFITVKCLSSCESETRERPMSYVNGCKASSAA
jgi:hypothetical protein